MGCDMSKVNRKQRLKRIKSCVGRLEDGVLFLKTLGIPMELVGGLFSDLYYLARLARRAP